MKHIKAGLAAAVLIAAGAAFWFQPAQPTDVEGGPDLVVPPVEIRLLDEVVVEVVLTAQLVKV